MAIYCDHNASSPLRPEALAAMLLFLREEYGNASSVHAAGSRARCAVEDARVHVAALIGAPAAEVAFTSGGTESNNLAVFGVARASQRRTIVTTPIEHSSVREPIDALRADGYAVREVPVDSAGRVAPAELAARLDDSVALVSIGWANNEVGTIQAIDDIAALCAARGVPLHVDAVQAAGKIPVHARGIALLSISAHKLGGPKGVGALCVRRGIPLRPLLLGGGQERGLRAGTENVAGIAGMGEACRLAVAEIGSFGEGCVALRDALWNGLREAVSDVRRNGPDGANCLPNTLNVSFAGVRGEALVAALDLDGIAVSSGSACAAGAGEPSHVLMALGRNADAARDGVRFSFGRTNTMADVECIVAATARTVQRIRAAQRSAP
ncbi:MAG: cysteine desulfurase family protein [Candidatus Binatia bacterium]